MLRVISFEQGLNLADMCKCLFNAYWHYHFFQSEQWALEYTRLLQSVWPFYSTQYVIFLAALTH